MLFSFIRFTQKKIYQPEGWIAFVNLKGICTFGVLEKGKELPGSFRTGPGVMVNEGYYNVGLKYEIGSWLVPGTSFLAREYEMVKDEGTIVGHLVVLDTSGKIIERIVDNKKGVILDHSFPSKNNNKVLYTYHIDKRKANPSNEELNEAFNPSLSLVVLDFKTKKEEVHIKFFSKGGNLELEESPWSPDEKKFVYTIGGSTKLIMEGKSAINPEEKVNVPGSYIFDIEKGKDIKFIPESYCAVWSPESYAIAYVKKDEVWVYDVEKDSHNLLFKLNSKDEIQDIHYTPKGDHLFVRLRDKKSTQKLINVVDGKEIPFTYLCVGLDSYTWR